MLLRMRSIDEWEGISKGNASMTTLHPSLDTENDDEDDFGEKPSELYGRYTWKIENFSQINRREVRSNAFEVGGHKWYILLYPHGIDVDTHLSLFLCVANRDRLLPGWSHFAQFSVAVVNNNPLKTKYSDTLHRFAKNEHDWGWKKFLELSRVLDGFVEADTFIIKVQVQVIRERADRPFRCLDRQYRRELVRVYLLNVEQIFRRFVEEKTERLAKLIKDKARWSSIGNFWLGINQKSRHQFSRVESDFILKSVVKQFFVEKEVTSTMLMDYLYSGLKSLQNQTKSNKLVKGKCNAEKSPLVQLENDTFVLVDDVLSLLKRVAVERLPLEDKQKPRNQKDSFENDERRLTEMGRKTIELTVLAHISSKIVAESQEALALKRQEELIREEEKEKAKSKPKRASRKGSRLLKT